MKLIEKDHPLTRAEWLWPWGPIYLNHCHAQFRYDFELEKRLSAAPFFITADQSYRLYVNGTFVHRGPARGYQAHWPFDELELAPFLRPGHNFIAVEAYNPGVGTFQYVHCGAAGMIAAGEWEGGVCVNTGSAWKQRRAPGNRPGTAMLSRQLAFQEDFDASLDDGSWITSPEAPDWPPDGIFRGFDRYPFGFEPWSTLEHREIPLLRFRQTAPVEATAIGDGEAAAGSENCDNISWVWLREEEKRTQEFFRPGQGFAVRSGDFLCMTVAPPGKGKYRAVTIDLGEIFLGSLLLEAEHCAGGEMIDCHFHQYLPDGIPHREHLIPVGEGGYLALANRLRTAPGKCRREFFGLFGCRHITLVFRNLTRPITVRSSFRVTGYPLSMKSRFQTSDAEWNAIWKICCHTQEVCCADAYMDTPWREQGQWWGDVKIQARNIFFMDGDTRLLRRGLYLTAGQKCPAGLTYGVAPCFFGGGILPDFSLTWIITLYDYWFQTGDIAVFRELRGTAEEILRYFNSPEASSGQLLKFDRRYWLFEDWAEELPRRGYPTFLNLWHLYALSRYRELLTAAGEHRRAAEIEQEIRERKSLILERFYDPVRGLFRPGLEEDFSAVPEQPSVHDQTLAILLNLVPEAFGTMYSEVFQPYLEGKPVAGAVPTSFWSSYVLDALALLGRRREALAHIRDRWGKMADYGGGCWEHFEFREKVGQSCSHAWSAHAATHLVELLTGIRQLAPEWRLFSLDPAAPDLLPAKGTIRLPLPPGPLTVAWEGHRCEVDVPEACTVRFRTGGSELELPGGKRYSLAFGFFWEVVGFEGTVHTLTRSEKKIENGGQHVWIK